MSSSDSTQPCPLTRTCPAALGRIRSARRAGIRFADRPRQRRAGPTPSQGSRSPRSSVESQLFNAGYYWEAHEVWEGLWHAYGRRGATADVLKGADQAGGRGSQGPRRPGARSAHPCSTRRGIARLGSASRVGRFNSGSISTSGSSAPTISPTIRPAIGECRDAPVERSLRVSDRNRLTEGNEGTEGTENS